MANTAGMLTCVGPEDLDTALADICARNYPLQLLAILDTATSKCFVLYVYCLGERLRVTYDNQVLEYTSDKHGQASLSAAVRLLFSTQEPNVDLFTSANRLTL